MPSGGTLVGPGTLLGALTNHYSPPYNKDEYCSFDKFVYKALQDIPVNEEWTLSHWAKVKVMDEISNTWNPDAITNITRNGTTFTATKFDGTTFTFDQQDNNTTYDVTSKTAAGLCPALPNETTTTKYLRQDGTWTVPPNDDTKYGVVSKSANGLAPQLPNETTTTKYLRQDGTWAVPPSVEYGTVSKSAAGLCPTLPNETTTTKYLRQDGTWTVPPNDNTTYSVVSTSANGLCPALPSSNQNIMVLKGDGAWSSGNVMIYAGNSYHAKAATTNGNTCLIIVGLGTTVYSHVSLKGTGGTTVTSDNDNNVTINSPAVNNTNVVNAIGYTPMNSANYVANSSSTNGYVLKGSGQNSKVWKTDSNGTPAWRADADTVTTNTWRGVQDNLTSSSTSDSLTANQGRVLNVNKASWPAWGSWSQVGIATNGASSTITTTVNGWYFWYTNYAGAGSHVKVGGCDMGSYTYSLLFPCKSGVSIVLYSTAGYSSYVLLVN